MRKKREGSGWYVPLYMSFLHPYPCPFGGKVVLTDPSRKVGKMQIFCPFE